MLGARRGASELAATYMLVHCARTTKECSVHDMNTDVCVVDDLFLLLPINQ